MKDILAETYFGVDVEKTMTLMDAINVLRAHDLLNIGELAERAISVQSGVEMCSKNSPNIDLVSGHQIKHATVKKPASSDYYAAYVTINTTAPILCVITNPIEKEQYFLHIPYSAHRHLSGSCISILFGKDGRSSTSKWWNYEVDSFAELCKIARNA
mgnify:CR=1 FL=1|jgi:hypothetical protein